MRKKRMIPVLMLMFLLGIRDGYITLWKNSETEPVNQFPYKAQYLPAADRFALEKGICVESPRELAQLLEDYLS